MFKITSVTLAANTTAEKIYTFNPNRVCGRLKIFSYPTTGTETVFLGTDDTVAVGAGHPVAANSASPVELERIGQDIYAVVTTAANSRIVIWEEYYGEDE